MNLAGLGRDEVTNYIRGTAGIEPSHALVDRVYEETEGNPFFLHEVVNLMTEEGTITSNSVSDIAIPEGVRQALGRRLDRLSEDANTLLQYAAVAGRQFAYGTLKLVTGRDDEALLRLIEEGLAARVMEETAQPGRYQFTHALMQETLLEELSTTRRVRMHGQVADAIERRYGDGAENQAARLAMHFTESATLNLEHVEKAIEYSGLAAKRAEVSAAWAEAGRHWGSVVTLTDERLQTPGPDFTNVLIAYGRAKRMEGDPRPGWGALMRARERARASDPAGFANATSEALTFMAPRERMVALAEDALDVVTVAFPMERAMLLATRLRLSPDTVAESAFVEAEGIASASGWSFAVAGLEDARGLLARSRGDARAENHFRAASTSYLEAGMSEHAAFASLTWSTMALALGDLDKAVAAHREAADLCRR